MSQTITKDSVLKILEGRFDYQSARNVMERALKEAGLAKKDSLGADDVESFCEALESFSTSVTSINEALRNTVGGGEAKKEAPKKPEPKKEEAKKPEPKKEEPKKEEPKKEEAKKPAAKKPASRKSSTTNKKAAPKKDDDKADDKKKK